jgi:predicted nucleic acid-binding protein
MTFPIFIDANIPIYATGRPHPLKQPCADVLELIGRRPGAFFTNAEVLQELLHRYLALRTWSWGKGVFQRFILLMGNRIEPVYAHDVEHASSLADQQVGLSSRDLVHLSVMARVGADQIVSADRGFDRLPDLKRLDPANLSAWRQQVEAGDAHEAR